MKIYSIRNRSLSRALGPLSSPERAPGLTRSRHREGAVNPVPNSEKRNPLATVPVLELDNVTCNLGERGVSAAIFEELHPIRRSSA